MNSKYLLEFLILLSRIFDFGNSRITVSAHPDNKYLNTMQKSIKTKPSGSTCIHPYVPVFSAQVTKFGRKPPPLECYKNQFEWVTVVNGSKLQVTAQAKRSFTRIVCGYTDVILENDYRIQKGKTIYLDADHVYHLQSYDTVEVKCQAKEAKWQSVLIGVRDSVELKAKPNLDPGMLNVLIFGFDSMSHNAVIRQLPKTYKYLTKVLGAQVLNGYNIVGDATIKAMIPIFTGKNELELPDFSKGSNNHADIIPFVWKDFQAKGYITALLEDLPWVGTFQYKKNGFLKPPTHHLMRTYYLMNPQDDCFGTIPQHKTFLNQIDRILEAYKNKRKFIYSFHGSLSHPTVPKVSVADKDVRNWLSRLKSSGVLNNTMVIFMTDHGSRHGKLRNTYYGKLEERLPFFSILVPKWFQTKYPLAYQNLRKNKDRLTSPYDIYPTLKHILNLKDFHPGTLKERSISLFREIPANRSCADASIEPHWCTCLNWVPLSSKENGLLKTLTQMLIKKLNSLTKHVREFCEPLKLKKVYWGSKLKHSRNLLMYKQNAANDDGNVSKSFKPVFGEAVKTPVQYYQILLETSINNGTYEATISSFNGTFAVKEKDISRTNPYGSQHKCIEKKFPQLGKYCYCKNNATNSTGEV